MKIDTRKRYIYGLVDPRDGNIRYVGQSLCPKTRYMRHLTDAIRQRERNKKLSNKDRWIVSLIDAKLSPTIITLSESTGKPDTDASEIKWIAHYRSVSPGLLLNSTDGGDSGATGISPSLTTRQRISAAKRGLALSPAAMKHIAKLADIRRGSKMSAEAIAKMRISQTGKKMSPEAIAKTAAARRRYVASEDTRRKMRDAKANISIETRQKMSLAQKGRTRDPELVARTAAGNRGKKRSPEHIAIISATHRGKVVSEQTRELLRQQRIGKKLSPDHARRSAEHLAQFRGRRLSDATKEKIRVFNLGKTLSEQHRINISKGLFRHYRPTEV